MTTIILFFVGILECAALYLIGKTGRELQIKAAMEQKLASNMPSDAWPRLALIIPVAGVRATTENALRSLLHQDYPSFMPVIVTATAEDEAVDMIHFLQQQFPGVRHVVAGIAKKCGQKNHNLLAAVADCGNMPDGYVFCDSTHIARPDFLRCLMEPIVRGESGIATGYHIVLPGDNSIVTLAYSQTVLLMRFLQGNAAFTQPWGGAMAITRNAFARYDIGSLWENNVVDDCSLGALLKREGAKIKLSAGALLETYVTAHPFSIWRPWFERQTLFLKFCMPSQWIALGFFAILVLLPPLWCIYVCLSWLLGHGSVFAAILAPFWLCVTCWIMNSWRTFLPSPPPRVRWLWAFFFACFIFGIVWIKTLFGNSLFWQNTLYQVGKGGKVLSIRRQ